MPKDILLDVEARSKLVKGIDIVANAVKTTLGPKGRNVALGKKYSGPTVTHDGVTVAKDIDLEDPFEDMGAQLIKEAASKTNDIAGDGTTTATVLAQAILKEGLKNVAAGANPMIIKRGLAKGVEAVVEEVRNRAKQIRSQDEIAQIASISANDTQIGELIGEFPPGLRDAYVLALSRQAARNGLFCSVVKFAQQSRLPGVPHVGPDCADIGDRQHQQQSQTFQ